jgi:hypothetical protein
VELANYKQMLGSKSSKKVKQPDQSFTTKEKVDWSSTEGYEAMKEVNNFLKWPSVWAGKKSQPAREVDFSAKQSKRRGAKQLMSNGGTFNSQKSTIKQSSTDIIEPVQTPSAQVESTPLSSGGKQLMVGPVQEPQKEGNLWKSLKSKLAARKLKKINEERSRQIKQSADSVSNRSQQVKGSIFHTKEEQRRQVAKLSSNKLTEVSDLKQAKPSVIQPINKANIEKSSGDVHLRKEKEISETVSKAPIQTLNKKDEQQRFREMQQSVEQKSWTRPAIMETNLVGGQTTLYFNWRRFWLDLTQWLIVTLFFLSLCGALFYLWRQNQIRQTADVDDRLAKMNQLTNLAENEVSDVLDFRLRLILVNELLDNHIYWNNFFSFLEKNTLANVFYQDFSGDTSGEYILKARTDNFDSMAKQIKVFRQSPDVLEVDTEGGEIIKNEPGTTEAGEGSEGEVGSSTRSQLNFSIKLKINPDLFFR